MFIYTHLRIISRVESFVRPLQPLQCLEGPRQFDCPRLDCPYGRKRLPYAVLLSGLEPRTAPRLYGDFLWGPIFEGPGSVPAISAESLDCSFNSFICCWSLSPVGRPKLAGRPQLEVRSLELLYFSSALLLSEILSLLDSLWRFFVEFGSFCSYSPWLSPTLVLEFHIFIGIRSVMQQ